MLQVEMKSIRRDVVVHMYFYPGYNLLSIRRKTERTLIPSSHLSNDNKNNHQLRSMF